MKRSAFCCATPIQSFAGKRKGTTRYLWLCTVLVVGLLPTVAQAKLFRAVGINFDQDCKGSNYNYGSNFGNVDWYLSHYPVVLMKKGPALGAVDGGTNCMEFAYLGCPAGTTWHGWIPKYGEFCRVPSSTPSKPPAPNPKAAGGCNCQEQKGGQGQGDPINTGNGNLYESQADYRGSGPFPLRFTRHYNSLDFHIGQRPAGYNWTNTYDRWITTSGSTVTVHRPNGRAYPFPQTAAGVTATSDADVNGRLTPLSNGWRYLDSADQTETYNSSGQLIAIADRAGYTQTLSYDSGGHLTTVTGPYGRTLTFTYNGAGRIATLTDPAGNTWQYGYDSNGNLTSVTDPLGNERQYLYGDGTFPHALTGIVDASGSRYATWSYDSQGRATLAELAGGADKTAVAYNSSGGATITEPSGLVQTNSFTTLLGVPEVSANSFSCPTCNGLSRKLTYDSSGNLTAFTDRNGHTTTYTYNSRNLQTSRTEAAGTPQARTITTTWDTPYRLPTQIQAPGRTTTYTYDSRGRLTQKTVTDTASGTTRTWTYGYGPGEDGVPGRLATVTDPLGHTTTYRYNSQGERTAITNALGQTTQITAYDADGRPLTVVGPNGLTTTLTYDADGRLTSRDRGGQTTSYRYNAVGKLSRVTLPDGSALTFSYDGAHRLTGIADSLGDHITYTLDASGNRVRTDAYDGNGKLSRSVQRVYNALNRLVKQIGAQGQTTTYAYDGDGDRTARTNPLGQTTTYTYDGLNRLTQRTDADGGVTRYDYNALNQLLSVTDPRGLETTYQDDAFGDRIHQSSPDTGTTTETYDADGNVLTRTDAKGQTTTYTYDALNRVTGITYADGSTLTNSYDTCPNGIGRRCQSTLSNGTTASWSYDGHGQVTGRFADIPVGRTDVRLSTTYRYDTAGRLRTMTYPSGLTVTYHYDAAGHLSGLDLNGQPYIANATYAPFGPVTGWDWSNGRVEQRTYNTDGQLTSATLGSGQRTFSYDAAGNITGISGPNTAQSLTYDALNRLTGDSESGKRNDSLAWTYDADGNRLTQDSNGTDTRYRIATASNRLRAVGGTAYRYDADGNLISDGVHTYGYDARNRLTTVDGGATATYLYNALGQRVEKQALLPAPRSSTGRAHASARALAVTTNRVSTTVLFAYDTRGHLIGEYDDRGDPIEETVYLGNLPVATVRDGTPYAIETDQLGAPRVITSPSGTVVWRWNSGPFGTGQPDERPSGGKRFVYNLRFPGQYYDAETGHDYNYSRDYDPALGRYTESDPDGLYAGINTYAYVGGNPVTMIDPAGLLGEGDGKGIFLPGAPTPSTCLERGETCQHRALRGEAECVAHTGELNAANCGDWWDNWAERCFEKQAPRCHKKPKPKKPCPGG